jgi:hypothetical protein
VQVQTEEEKMAKLAARHSPKLKIRSFNYKHAEEEQITEVLVLLAEGNRISKLTRVKVIKEDTILDRGAFCRGAATEPSEKSLMQPGQQPGWITALARYERRRSFTSGICQGN